jgi:hypothetical protein
MTSQNNDSIAKKDRLIVDRLWQMKKAASEILELTNTDLVSENGEKYHDCDGKCGSCIIGGICMAVVDVSAFDIIESKRQS